MSTIRCICGETSKTPPESWDHGGLITEDETTFKCYIAKGFKGGTGDNDNPITTCTKYDWDVTHPMAEFQNGRWTKI